MSEHQHDLADAAHHDEEDHEHTGPLVELVTVRDWLRYAITRFNRAKLFFGHGTDNAFDEAAYLILHTLALPIDRLEPFLDACITLDERLALFDIIERRVSERIPAAYLTHEAWLGGYRFYVDERVIVPRSYFVELLETGLAPWVASPDSVGRALDMCTGSACLAILMADVFSQAKIVAADISTDALAVARTNVDDYQLADRIELVQTDLFENLKGARFDLIISNPPYVTAQAMAQLPSEYRHEPGLALGAGEDGLDIVWKIIAQARNYLTPNGLLMIEVGHNRQLVDTAFPGLPITWLSTEHSEDKVFMLRASDLP